MFPYLTELPCDSAPKELHRACLKSNIYYKSRKARKSIVNNEWKMESVQWENSLRGEVIEGWSFF
jgi:hypothetical protein